MTFDPIPGGEGVCNDRICASMLLHSRFHLFSYAAGQCSEKLNFDHKTPLPGSVCE